MRVIAILAILICGNFGLNGQCLKGNCVNGRGYYKLSSQSNYEGGFRQGQFEGQGKLQFANGDLYVGNFRQGKKHGVGKYTYANKSYYHGEFSMDERSGSGKMTFANGDEYKGMWYQGLMDGEGTYIFKNGDIYQGAFANNTMHGSGQMKLRSGETLTGNWQNNEYLGGQTKVETAAQSTHIQDLKNCTTSYCHNEDGAYYYGDGSVYIGSFVSGNPQGEGKVNYINGDIYEGGWKNHAPHGKGVMHMTDGSKIAGTFNNGQLIKRTYEQTSPPTKPTPQQSVPAAKTPGTQIYALVVGVATYNHMKSLKYTDDDAYQLFAFLKSPKGGALPDDQISLLIDDGATRSSILAAAHKVVSKADEDDVVMIYLSGHGLDGAYVPYDFDGQRNLVHYREIFEILDASSAKNKIMITDACHSGSMYASRGTMESSLADFYQTIQTSKGGTAIMTSSKEEEVSLEYSGMRQGIFSHFLIRGLKGEANKNGDHIIQIGELYQYVHTNVQAYTNKAQTPLLKGDYDQNMPVALIYK